MVNGVDHLLEALSINPDLRSGESWYVPAADADDQFGLVSAERPPITPMARDGEAAKPGSARVTVLLRAASGWTQCSHRSYQRDRQRPRVLAHKNPDDRAGRLDDLIARNRDHAAIGHIDREAARSASMCSTLRREYMCKVVRRLRVIAGSLSPPGFRRCS
jgi:hypothetical protein